ncbi:uncharacterized protein K452DRAFT_289231 [Aplosporella prunicola CBS 121167]|uniref:Uncharacterized protein n=1 Tax=Aplosporella prunicola CBS 121167 TaxID=1176127 RepID=A0A6A6BBJ2_9PEZI|nr:uncharacterized protein K452DRAFT_289231 [Aplosporella prunicola CBS 121167]KAF2139851.1 hypothetical protein K452DRAFT_289231 [Aplosporella prunicola CBS 121167]
MATACTAGPGMRACFSTAMMMAAWGVIDLCLADWPKTQACFGSGKFGNPGLPYSILLSSLVS